jgi:hypothetical protein
MTRVFEAVTWECSCQAAHERAFKRSPLGMARIQLYPIRGTEARREEGTLVEGLEFQTSF